MVPVFQETPHRPPPTHLTSLHRPQTITQLYCTIVYHLVKQSTMSAVAKPVIAVAFYSTMGHITKLAESIIKGVEESGATAKPYLFAETLTPEILEKMHGVPKPDYPNIQPEDLRGIDGLIIGTPTRYGRVPAQVSTFIDATGGLFATGALVGVPVTQFTSVGGQHGGHEATVLSTMPFYIQMGMVYVPFGYQFPEMNNNAYAHGVSPYGVSTIANHDGSRKVLEQESAAAQQQGKYFGDFVAALKTGRQAYKQ